MKGMLTVILIGIIIFIVALSAYIVIKSIPFEPLQIHNSYFVDDEVCPLQEVTLINDIEVKPGIFEIDNAEGFTTWVGKYDDRPYGGTYFNESLVEAGRHKEESATRRIAPPIAGEWYGERREVVTGNFFGIERTQVETTQTGDNITVLEKTDEQCKKEG